MSENSFSFQSQFKTGKVIKAIPGGAGDWGDHHQSYLTPEQILIVKPPLTKEKVMTKEKGGGAGNNLQLPKGTIPKSAGGKMGGGGGTKSMSPARKTAGTSPVGGGGKRANSRSGSSNSQQRRKQPSSPQVGT